MPDAADDPADQTDAPDTSVILPAYNVAPFLERAARSALSQEGVAVELIIIDDASSDETHDVAQALAAGDPRVRVLRHARNLGCAPARNAGAAAARGRWIALLDADDAFLPGRLARLIGMAEAHGFDALSDLPLFHDLKAGKPAPRQLPADGALELLTPRRFLERSVDPDAPLDYGLLKPIYRRALAASGRMTYPADERHGADFFGYLGALAAGVRFGVLHEALYAFSTRIGGVTGEYSPGSVTPVNYRAIASATRRHIEALRRAGRPLGDLPLDEACAMLELRVAKALELNAKYGWNTLRKGAWDRHWRWLRQDPRNPPLLAAMVARKTVRRALGRGPGS
ncbi:glycosyltransferase family 2 protein [Oceanicella actignis]|uniref:glycosyltransferase family 2 protein n=1 Tax=Oceanicella actignis TaxID=1189325 RepID=UPI00125C8243|nr:glycosyltransferase family 2 protein [Oceanicella actignis]TYO88784.1 succinoglycan biosynthesis protein ExoO [Oceanicella actignis]